MDAYRITIRGDCIELRGVFKGTMEELATLAESVEPFGLCIASPMEGDVLLQR
jgi:hypothetical protein